MKRREFWFSCLYLSWVPRNRPLKLGKNVAHARFAHELDVGSFSSLYSENFSWARWIVYVLKRQAPLLSASYLLWLRRYCVLKFPPNVARARFAHELDGAKTAFSPYVARARFAHELDGAKRCIFPLCSSCAFRARAR